MNKIRAQDFMGVETPSKGGSAVAHAKVMTAEDISRIKSDIVSGVKPRAGLGMINLDDVKTNIITEDEEVTEEKILDYVVSMDYKSIGNLLETISDIRKTKEAKAKADAKAQAQEMLALLGKDGLRELLGE